jgi:hypothetical protein
VTRVERGRSHLHPEPSALPGAVILVAYRPNPDLFRIQLDSIRSQTRSDFHVYIAADGDETEVRDLVASSVGDDERFEVIGFDVHVGVYLNAERVLAAVPRHVGWVALSDHDDRWYPDKLERLVPLLDRTSAAVGQGRVVTAASGAVLRERTGRRAVPAADLVFENQVSGGLTVIRRDLLDVALPFPRMNTPSQLPDHWLGMCAVAASGYVVLDEVVQDYVQHDANLVGEVLEAPRRQPIETVRRIARLADRYEGGHSPVRCARMCQVSSFGWRREMVRTLLDRVPDPPPDLVMVGVELELSSGLVSMTRLLRRARRSPHAAPSVIDGFIPGIPYEIYARLRRTRLSR